MNYAELTASTSEMIRRMMLKNTIETAVLGTLCLILIILTVIMIRGDRKIKKVVGGYKYGPTVTDTVQVDQYGTEYHRMGIAGRR